jgi:hypothetical protein
MKRIPMESAVGWFLAIGALLIGIGGTIYWGNGSKTIALWIGVVGVIGIVLAGGFQLQGIISKAIVTETESTERPWIFLGNPTVSAPLKFFDAGAQITLLFPLKNTGKSPALNVSVQARLIPLTSKRSAPNIEQDRLIAELKATPDGLVFGERTLFQNESVIFEQQFFMDAAEYRSDQQITGLLPMMVACAVYRLKRGGERHYTCIVGALQPKPPGYLGVGFPTDKGDIPANQIEAVQLYAGYVD